MSNKIPLPNTVEFSKYYNEHTLKETAVYFGVSESVTKTWRNHFKLPLKRQRHKQLGPFTENQLQIITGSLLGDGHLSSIKNGQNSRFVENHSAKQIAYLKWKYDNLLPFSLTISKKLTKGRKILDGKVITDPNKQYKRVTLKTITHPQLSKIEKQWYLRQKNGRVKHLPSDFSLTPLMLAVWYYDDGHNDKKSRNAYISVYSWSTIECSLFLQELSNLGIECTQQPANTNPKKIMIRSRSYDRFLNMVSSYIPEHILPYKVKRKTHAEL